MKRFHSLQITSKVILAIILFLGFLTTECSAGPYNIACGVNSGRVVVIASLASGEPHPTCSFACVVIQNGRRTSTPVCTTTINDGSQNSVVCSWQIPGVSVPGQLSYNTCG